jgi:hypothetical protein
VKNATRENMSDDVEEQLDQAIKKVFEMYGPNVKNFLKNTLQEQMGRPVEQVAMVAVPSELAKLRARISELDQTIEGYRQEAAAAKFDAQCVVNDYGDAEADENVRETAARMAERIRELTASESRAVESLRRIFVGGNHLATALVGLLGPNFPTYQTSLETARGAIEDGGDHYDVWVAWRTIMIERDAMLARMEQTASCCSVATSKELESLAQGCVKVNPLLAAQLRLRAATILAGKGDQSA